MPRIPARRAAAVALRRAAARTGALRPALPVLCVLLLAAPLAGALREGRTAPYGDLLTVHPAAARLGAAAPVLRTGGGALAASDARTGAPLWTYRRPGRRPVSVLAAPGHGFALWDDGMVTDTGPAPAGGPPAAPPGPAAGAVRWHRVMPGAADGALWALDPQVRMLAVVGTARISAFRTEDGDLRWTFPAPADCAFEPAGLLRRGGVLLVPRPCTDPARSWTEGLIAIDPLGRVTPTRRPLGNDRPGEATHSPGK
ncbi:hypothetical protein [Streptomyces sp. NPDC089919]|uniref:hypothetical protein n=1 Tax=Streptomyces sp. NPDC089919 TaxID=3155188 RepID=UPI00343038DD